MENKKLYRIDPRKNLRIEILEKTTWSEYYAKKIEFDKKYPSEKIYIPNNEDEFLPYLIINRVVGGNLEVMPIPLREKFIGEGEKFSPNYFEIKQKVIQRLKNLINNAQETINNLDYDKQVYYQALQELNMSDDPRTIFLTKVLK